MAINVDLHDADPRQNEEKIRSIMEERRPAKWVSHIQYVVNQVLIRGTLILIGLALLAGALWCFSHAVDLLSKPFATLSPLQLLGGLFAGFGGFILLWMAFGVAFVKGESRAQFDAGQEDALRTDAEQVLMLRESWNRDELAKESAQKTRQGKVYAAGRTAGRWLRRH